MKTLDESKKEAIKNVLEAVAWNRVKASQLLKISYRGLRNLIKRYDLKPPKALR